MSISIACYIEHRELPNGEWQLFGNCVHNNLKYVFTDDIEEFDINSFDRISKDRLSAALQDKVIKYSLFENDVERVYAQFYTVSLKRLEAALNMVESKICNRLTTLCKAMGIRVDIESVDDREELYVEFDPTKPCIPVSRIAVADTMRDLLLLKNLGQISMLCKLGNQASSEITSDGSRIDYEVRFVFVLG